MGYTSSNPTELVDGTLLVKLELRGILDADDARALVTDLRRVLQKGAGARKVRLLMDQRQQQTITAEARRILSDETRNPTYERIAVLGGSVFMRTVSKFILRAAGESHKARFFSDLPAALGWLQEASDSTPQP